MYIALVKPQSKRRASYQPAFMDINNTRSCHVHLGEESVSPGCLTIPFNSTKWWSWSFLGYGVVLVLSRVGTILGSGYEIKGQNYVAICQRSNGCMREVLHVTKTKTIR